MKKHPSRSLWLILLIAFLAVNSTWAGVRPLVKPPALRPGDTIAFVSPTKARDANAVRIAREALEAKGFNVVEYDQIHITSEGYFSGTDEVRAEALMDAFTNPDIDAVFPVTGGYGVTRILDRLDFDAIRKNPKIVIGFSDITALHLALVRRAGLVSFHCPFPTYTYREDPSELRVYANDHFWGALAAESYRNDTDGPGWVVQTENLTSPVITMVPGVARGPLMGGNLSLVAALMGTPYEIETEGSLLFLEDIGEAPYRIDRMLGTLELAGKLDGVAGVILGQWRGCEADDPERDITLDQAFERYFAGLGVPVVRDFPVGHVIENATFPLGIQAELDAGAGTLRILEDPVNIPSD